MIDIKLTFLLGWVTLSAVVYGQTCYDLSGNSTDDIPCPDTKYCCGKGSPCLTEGICRDPHNSGDGSLTYAFGGPANLSTVFITSTCVSWGDVSDCPRYCEGKGKNGGQSKYMRSCNDALTEFCCHDDDDNLLDDSLSCCGNSTRLAARLEKAPVLLNSTQSSSSSLTTTPASSSSLTTTPTLTSSPPSTQTILPSLPTPHSTVKPTGLSTGAKAGIGVGVAAGALVVIAALAFFLIRRKKKSVASPPPYEISAGDQSQQMASSSTTPKRV